MAIDRNIGSYYAAVGIPPQEDPQKKALATLQRLRREMQGTDPVTGMNPDTADRISAVSPHWIPPATQEQIFQNRTPLEIATGDRTFFQKLGGVGKAVLNSFNPWEDDISTREKVFRSLNLGSLALPIGFVAKAPMLLKAFPALRALSMTRKGQVALTAAGEGLLSGGLEVVKGADEQGNQHIVSNTMLGAVLGGALGHFTGEAVRAARRETGKVFLESIDDMGQVARESSPLFTNDFAVLAPHPGFDPSVQNKMLEELTAEVGNAGYLSRNIAWGKQNALMIPGLDETTAVDLAAKMDSPRLLTTRGEINLEKGVVYPSTRSGSVAGSGANFENFPDLLRYTTASNEPVIFGLGVDAANPVRLGSKVGSGAPMERINQIFDSPSSQGWTKRMWEGFSNFDSLPVLRDFYRRSVRAINYLEVVGKKVGDYGRMAKLAELSKGKYATFLDYSMRFGVPKKIAGGVGSLENVSTLSRETYGRGLMQMLGDLTSDEVPQFQAYGFARWVKQTAEDYGEEVLPMLNAQAVISPSQADAILANPPNHFDKLFEEMTDWQNDVLRETLVDSGLISPDQFKSMVTRANGEKRVVLPLKSVEDMATKGFDTPEDVLLAFDPVDLLSKVGKEANFEPWIGTMVERTAQYARMSDQHRLVNEVVETLTGAVQEGKVVEHLNRSVIDIPVGRPVSKLDQLGFDTNKTWYHGTPIAYDDVPDPTASDRFGLFGGGAYFTEDPHIASEYTKAYREGADALAGPNVKPVHLKIENPIDMDAIPEDPKKWMKILSDAAYAEEGSHLVSTDFYRALQTSFLDSGAIPKTIQETEHFQDIMRQIEEVKASYAGEMHVPSEVQLMWQEIEELERMAFPPAHLLTPEQIESVLSEATNEHWFNVISDLVFDSGVSEREAVEAMQDLLKEMGHDGITHLGGGRVGDVRHKVMIAFDKPQIASVFEEAPLKDLPGEMVIEEQLSRAVDIASHNDGVDALANLGLRKLARPEDATLGAKTFTRRVQNKLPDGDYATSVDMFEVTDEGLWDAMQFLGPVELGNWKHIVKAVSVPATILRATTTLGFEFMAKNPIRDVAFAGVTAGFNPASVISGLSSLLKQDDFYHMWLRSGGPRSALVSLDRPVVNEAINSALQRADGAPRKLANVIFSPRQWLSALQDVSEGMESMTRLGMFRQKFTELAKNADSSFSLEQALIDASLASKQGSVNFAMAGSSASANALRQMAAFWNAGLQGVDTMVKSAYRDPKGFAVRGSALTAVSLSAYLAIRNDEEYQYGVEDWEKMLFWHVRSPGGELLRIPKPFEPGIIFGSLPESFLQAVDRENPEILDNMALTAISQMGTQMLPLPTAIMPIIDVLRNVEGHTGNPIIPESMKGEIDPDFQIQGSTSALAVGIARFLNQGEDSPMDKVSPLAVDHIMSGYTGGLGKMVYSDVPEAMIDLYRSIHPDLQPSASRNYKGGAKDIPGIRTFYSTFPYSSASVKRIYELGEEARIVGNTSQFLEDSYEVDTMVDYMMEQLDMIGYKDAIQGNVKMLMELREARDQVMLTGIPLKEKQAQMLHISRQMHNAALPLVKLLESKGIH